MGLINKCKIWKLKESRFVNFDSIIKGYLLEVVHRINKFKETRKGCTSYSILTCL